jgi:hypothetical protein
MAEVRLYHVTPISNLDSILATGLDPAFSDSSQNAVYLVASSADALAYIVRRGEEDAKFAVLEVIVIDEDKVHLGPDDDELPGVLAGMDDEELLEIGLSIDVVSSDMTWRQSLDVCSYAVHKATIAPSSIVMLGMVDASVMPLEIRPMINHSRAVSL